QANFDQPAPGIAFAGSAFRVASEPSPWTRRDARTPRRAAVSGFGFGGINAHVVLEEYDPELSRSSSTDDRRAPLSRPPSVERSLRIAIVGMEARFGSLRSLRAFQEAVLAGTSVVGESKRDGHSFPGAYLDPLEVGQGELRVPPN